MIVTKYETAKKEENRSLLRHILKVAIRFVDNEPVNDKGSFPIDVG